ncbi:MAG: membrane-binding protein [Cyclobacteriaceae bacterium]|nr:membrane-binding protein [Cyclobacteriaceae bacterium]
MTMNQIGCFEYFMDYLDRIILCFSLAVFMAFQSVAQAIEVRTYHDDSRTHLKELFYISDSATSILSGPYKSYYLSGALEKEGFYKNNYPDSLWKYYFENGRLKMRGTLKYGSNHGLWEYFFENGNLNMAGMIMDAKREGTWRFYYENGNLKSQGNYKTNKKDGIWNYFYEEGELKAQAFYQEDEGIYKEFYSDGKLKAEGLNKDGQSDSTWVFYHENGNVKAIGNYERGKCEGHWVYYFNNEKKSAEGNYQNGTKEGKWIYYHENGEVSSEGALRDGKKEGYWRIFGKDGSFKADGLFEQNEGKYTEYYESGKVKSEGQIVDGKNDGVWTYYYEDGTKEGACYYTLGNGSYTGYYKDGNIKMKGKVEGGVNVGIWELYDKDGDVAGYYRPYYEDERPVYKLVEKKKVPRGDYVKPAYKYKSYKSKYFDPVINEYKGVIVATNPIAPFLGQLPLSVEYYIEERLGYELQAVLLRQPFFTKDESVSINDVYKRGFNVSLRQKFYHPEGKLGMFYFGHEVRLTSLKHFANVIDSIAVPAVKNKINTKETKFEYAFFVGDRWMRLLGDRYNNNSVGFTLDAFLGFGFGYRLYQKNYPGNAVYDLLFEDTNASKFAISPRIGINVGFIF